MYPARQFSGATFAFICGLCSVAPARHRCKPRRCPDPGLGPVSETNRGHIIARDEDAALQLPHTDGLPSSGEEWTMNAVFTLGRIALVLIFIISGAQKLLDIAGTAEQIQSKLGSIPASLTDITSQIEVTLGMPIWQTLAVVVALIEVVGGLLVAFNVLTRTAALVLLVFVAVATFYFHDFWNMSGPDRANNITEALKNLGLMGAFLMLAAWPRRVAVVETAGHERLEPL